MPVQINEVIVKTVVDPRPSGGNTTVPECPPAANSGSESEMIQQVLAIIKEKKER
jgi:hypothetical protein